MENTAKTPAESVSAQIHALIVEMKAKAPTLEALRDSIEVEAIVREIALPIIDDNAPPSFIPAVARATLLGAWVRFDARRAISRETDIAA